MGSTANYKPTPGSALPAVLLSPASIVEQIVLSAAPTVVPIAGGTILQNQALVCSIPAGSILEGQEWGASISGRTVVGAGGNFILKVYGSTAAITNLATAQAGVLLKTSGAISLAGARTDPFLIKLSNCVFDSVSGKLVGEAEMIVAGNLVARTLMTAVTGVNNQSAIPTFNLAISAQWGLANAANQIVVENFEIDF
jgi:hypothetical protein